MSWVPSLVGMSARPSFRLGSDHPKQMEVDETTMVDSAAEDWPTRVRRLEQEVSGLRRAMRTRGLIEQAKGVLAERLHCDPETAFAHLSKLSQDTNTPLVDVAADVVDTIVPHTEAAPDPALAPTATGVPAHEPASDPTEEQEVTVVAGLAPAAATTWPPRTSRALRRTVSALNAAEDLTAVTAAATTGLAEVACAGTAVFAVDPNGAFSLLASDGWTAQQATDARRIPSLITTPMTEVVRLGHPIVVDGLTEHELAMVGPGEAVAGYPVTSGTRVVGVLLFSWQHARHFTAFERAYLDQIAKAAGRSLERLWSTGVADTASAISADLTWIYRVIEGTSGRTQLLTPIRDGSGVVVDFTIEAMSQHALADAPDAVGRRLLDVYPQLLDNGVFAAYAQALADGIAWERPAQAEQAQVDGVWQRVVKARRAAPVGGALIVSWRRLDEFERLQQQVNRMEHLGRFGWCEWNPAAKRMWWSSGAYRLLGRDPRKGPLSRKALVELAEPQYRQAFAEALRDAARGGYTTLDISMRPLTADAVEEPLRVRVFVEHDSADQGVPDEVSSAVRIVLQDVSGELQLDEQLRRTQAQASAQRMRLAAEHELTRELMNLVYPARMVDTSVHGLRVVGRHVATDLSAPLRGDFCDAYALPDGDLLIVVGDVAGQGMTAAATVARLLPPVPVLGTAGLAPDAILRMINAELHRTPNPPLAGMVLARVDHDTKVLTWAQAGQYPPILIRGRNGSKELTATPLKSTQDPALGILPDATYSSGSEQLRPGDLVVFYTDGVFDRKARDPLRNLSNRVGRLAIAGEPESALRLPTPAHADEACLVVLSCQDTAAPRQR
jgi:Stage II sporulation protein E (SpoIIE)/ANTAR domain/GAF domain